MFHLHFKDANSSINTQTTMPFLSVDNLVFYWSDGILNIYSLRLECFYHSGISWMIQ